MPDLLILFLAACGTALATGLGAIPVWFLGDRAAALTPFLLGIAAGVMGVASVFGLLVPAAEEGSVWEVPAGLLAGGVLLGIARRRLRPEAAFMGRRGADLGARLRGPLRPQLPRGSGGGDRVCVRTGGAEPFRDRRDRDPERPRGHQRRDPDGECRLRPRAPVLGRRRDQRAAAGRCDPRLPRGRIGDGAAAVLLRLRGRRDAEPDRPRAAPAGLRPAPPSRSQPRPARRRRRHVGPGSTSWRISQGRLLVQDV